MNEFARRLKEARLEASMTQDQLAKALDVSKSTISMWENGNRIPPIDVVFPLARALKKSPGYFTGGSVKVLSDGGAAPGSAYYDPLADAKWDKLEALFQSLSEEDQEQLINYAKFLLSQKEK